MKIALLGPRRLRQHLARLPPKVLVFSPSRYPIQGTRGTGKGAKLGMKNHGGQAHTWRFSSLYLDDNVGGLLPSLMPTLNPI